MGRISDLISRRRKFEPEGHRVSGGMAEVRLMRLVKSVCGNAKAWDGVRIPDLERGGRREIDMVIGRGDEILLVEQKHWSGSVAIKNGRFIQTRRTGEVMDHGNIHDWTKRKGRLLEEIHENRCGEGFTKSTVVIVFSNNSLELGKMPEDMMVVDEIGLISLIENGDRSPPPTEVIETMEGFGTWDTVHLNGGMALNGDIIELGLGLDEWYAKMEGRGEMVLNHSRSIFSLLSGVYSDVIVKDRRGECFLSFTGRPQILMHVVGKKEPEYIEWSSVFRIELSNLPNPWGI